MTTMTDDAVRGLVAKHKLTCSDMEVLYHNVVTVDGGDVKYVFSDISERAKTLVDEAQCEIAAHIAEADALREENENLSSMLMHARARGDALQRELDGHA